MVKYKFKESERERFVELQKIVKKFYLESGYIAGPETFGCAEGDLSISNIIVDQKINIAGPPEKVAT